MAPGKLATALASHGFGKAEIDKIFGAYQAEVPPM
jgi:hypothetical protein